MERALQQTIKRHMKDAVECVSARTAVFVYDVECFAMKCSSLLPAALE